MTSAAPKASRGARALGELVILVIVAIAVVAFVRPWMQAPSSNASASSSPAPSPTQLVSPPRSFATADYEISVETGIAPQIDPAQLAQLALDRIAAGERQAGQSAKAPRILSIAAYKGRNAPAEYGSNAFDSYEIVWIVRAEGTFVAQFGPLGANKRIESTGWFAFDDTGSPLATGFPLKS